VQSRATCECCGRARGFAYTGPVYAVEEIEVLCPWCIADGSAAEKFDAGFTDAADEATVDVPPEVVAAIERTTPGFAGIQQEHWLYHCGDGAAFLGPVGAQELHAYPEAVESLRAANPEELIESLDGDGSPRAYLFQCRRCGTHLAYADFD
jgi:uncharacterized protein CbrC (UPF0167 family)